MSKKVIIFFGIVLIAAGLLLILRRRTGRSSIVDEFGLSRSRFPYVKWENAKSTMKVQVAEIIDYKTFRTETGEIILLCALNRAINSESAVLFMKKKVLDKTVVLVAFSVREDYSGVSYGVIFYDNGSRCLNRELYDNGFVDVKIEGRAFNSKEWFGSG